MSTIAERSATLGMGEEMRRLRDTGMDVIHLAGGTATFDVPADVKAEVQRVLAEGPVGLTDSCGLLALREALSEELRLETDVSVAPDELVVTMGGKEAVMVSILAVVEPGDEVLLPDPTWVTYEPWIRRAGGIAVRFSMGKINGFRPDWNEVADLLSPRTRLIVLTTPHNPTGTVLRLSELTGLAEVLANHSALILCDESNSAIRFDGISQASPVQVAGLRERSIVIGSFSKNFAMAGWRIGFVWSPQPHLNNILAAHQHAVSCVPAFIQKAALAMLCSPEKETLIANMVQAYHQNRQVLVDGLNDIPGVHCHYPEGAYNAFPDFSSFGYVSSELAHLLLTKMGVSSVPGDAFGQQGEGHLRMAFTLPPDRLNEAVSRISDLCLSLAGRLRSQPARQKLPLRPIAASPGEGQNNGP